MIHRPFTVMGPHGDPIHGDVRIPEGPPPKSAVVVVHGFKGFKDWAFFPYVCTNIAGAGFAVVSFNFTRNGIGDDPLEFTELESFAQNTYSRELGELEWLLTEVSRGDLLPRRPDSMGVLGHSRGGAQAILAARGNTEVKALATWAAVGNLDRWTPQTVAEWRETGRVYVLNGRTGQQMPLDVTLLEDFEANRERLDIAAASARVAVPWLVVHGDDDLTVHVGDARELVAAAPNATLLVIDGAGHTFEARHPFETSTRQLNQALQSTIRHFRAALGR